MTLKSTLLKTLKGTSWVIISLLSLLLVHNAILYFTHGGEYGILPEKLTARNDVLWNIAFYIHLPSGIICLLSPLLLFARRANHMASMVHTKIGKLYVWITLLIVCPTGLYLALYAKGGFLTQAGFVVQDILLAFFTYSGYKGVVARNKTLHIRFMIRSYAAASVVLTFRILHLVFFFLDLPYQENYAFSQWLGVCINLWLAEIFVFFVPDSSITNNVSLKNQHV